MRRREIHHAGRGSSGCLAGNRARAAVNVARHWVPSQRDSECLCTHDGCVP
jgi:hypothetical protein